MKCIWRMCPSVCTCPSLLVGMQKYKLCPDEEITPFEYFKQMCRDEVIENFVEQSNLYCVQKTGRSLNTNKNEMDQFLGIHIMAGIVNMPSCRMYWADSKRYG